MFSNQKDQINYSVKKLLCSSIMGIYLKPRGQFLSISSDFKKMCEITFFNKFEIKTFPT